MTDPGRLADGPQEAERYYTLTPATPEELAERERRQAERDAGRKPTMYLEAGIDPTPYLDDYEVVQ